MATEPYELPLPEDKLWVSLQRRSIEFAGKPIEDLSRVEWDEFSANLSSVEREQSQTYRREGRRKAISAFTRPANFSLNLYHLHIRYYRAGSKRATKAHWIFLWAATKNGAEQNAPIALRCKYPDLIGVRTCLARDLTYPLPRPCFPTEMLVIENAERIPDGTPLFVSHFEGGGFTYGSWTVY